MAKLLSSFLIGATIFFCIVSFLPKNVFADDAQSCPNRYLTLVNPVRGRSLWRDPTLAPLKEQYQDAKKYSFPVTWLLQYDALKDRDLVGEISNFDLVEEGILLEVSRDLADDSKVAYPIYLRWSDPGAVFLSAYSPSDRRKIIDTLFRRYKEIFGNYPKSVGAWWIDSYSLQYIFEKYGIKAAMIVADQRVTDSYGVWGQWWGFPYKPSMANILVPAISKNNLINVVIIQWAQRDPILAYGAGASFSQHSLQANDYKNVDNDINYFKNLVASYLDCRNPLGQITIGLETGMESLEQPFEYQKQLNYLATVHGLTAVTMSSFADRYSGVYAINPNKLLFGAVPYEWEMTGTYRKNEGLGDYVNYNQEVSFPDFFIKDGSSFLNRALPIVNKNIVYRPWFLLGFLLFLVVALRRRNFWDIYISGVLFSYTAFGLILRSKYQYGWQVFYGPRVINLELTQIFLVAVSFGIIWLLKRAFKKNFNVWFIPLSYGIDAASSLLRYTEISGYKYFGFLIDSARIFGVKFNNSTFTFANELFGPIQSHALLKIDFETLWQNSALYFIILPIAHIALAAILWFIYRKLNRWLRVSFLVILLFLFVLYLFIIFSADPVSVLAL